MNGEEGSFWNHKRCSNGAWAAKELALLSVGCIFLSAIYLSPWNPQSERRDLVSWQNVTQKTIFLPPPNPPLNEGRGEEEGEGEGESHTGSQGCFLFFFPEVSIYPRWIKLRDQRLPASGAWGQARWLLTLCEPPHVSCIDSQPWMSLVGFLCTWELNPRLSEHLTSTVGTELHPHTSFLTF